MTNVLTKQTLGAQAMEALKRFIVAHDAIIVHKDTGVFAQFVKTKQKTK